MGIPSFARVIIEKYKNTHSTVKGEDVDHFFIDFNSIVYNCYGKIDKKKIQKLSDTKIENMIISDVIKYLKHIITETVKPQKSVFIAIDGSAPCAKVRQQRFRRFKGILLADMLKEVKKKNKVEEEKTWNTSCNIAPGTKFMAKLSKNIEKYIKSGDFSSHSKKKIKIILSDANVPGEGEHKYMDLLRDMENKNSKESIVVFSPDADVIVLSLASHKNNIRILRTAGDTAKTKILYANQEFYYLIIDNIRKVFIKELIKVDKGYDEKRMVTDYNLLTTFAGNDFVLPIPYLKVKDDRLRTPMGIYKKLLPELGEHLVLIDKKGEYSLNHKFMLEFFKELSKTEEYRMRNIQKNIHRERKIQVLNQNTVEREMKMEPYEIEFSRIEHKPFYSKFNPLYDKYNKEFDKLNFFQDTEVWKEQYYKYFFGISKKNMEEYNDYLENVIINYLESLMFVTNYYLKGEPAWRWYYKYRIAPLPSDIYNFIKNNKDINDRIVFKKTKPIKPLEQLMLILPPQMEHILPKKYGELMVSMDSNILDLYPEGFELDVYPGQKLIYTEPLLPEMDVDRVLEETKKVEKSLTASEKKRNKISKTNLEIII
jgi:5'-3' exonuclease